MYAFIASAFVVALAGPAASAPSPVADAERWVALVDAGKYSDSWSATGRIFQLNTTREAWIKAVGAARGPLGALVSRKLFAETRSTSLPGAPDGDYDTFQFSTTFANKTSAVETIVLAHEAEGWRVEGYFVR